MSDSGSIVDAMIRRSERCGAESSIRAPIRCAEEKAGKNQPENHLQSHPGPNRLVLRHRSAFRHEIRKSFCTERFAEQREERIEPDVVI